MRVSPLRGILCRCCEFPSFALSHRVRLLICLLFVSFLVNVILINLRRSSRHLVVSPFVPYKSVQPILWTPANIDSDFLSDEYLLRARSQRRHFHYPPFRPGGMISNESSKAVPDSFLSSNVALQMHTRSFYSDPIAIADFFGPEDAKRHTGIHRSPPSASSPYACNLPCIRESRERADVVRNPPSVVHAPGYHREGRPGTSYNFYSTMENAPHLKTFDLYATTQLSGEVVVQYFAWDVFNVVDPSYPVEKTSKKMMAAFISNCRPQRRLNVLKELQRYGVSVDSFGECENNAQEPIEIVKQCNDGIQCKKEKLAEKYLFVYAPENSETEDYVSEKFFLPFCLGSVPVTIGPSNIANFAPSEKSFIDRYSYNSTEEMAKHMIYLAQNPDKYAEYLSWKVDGPSRHFVALTDLGNVHSWCRLCIRTADYIRMTYQNYVDHEQVDRKRVRKENLRWFRVRERGSLYLSVVYVPREYFSVLNLRLAIKKRLGFNDLYNLYFLWDRIQVPITRPDLPTLKDGEELEVIFLDSQIGKRGLADDWFANVEERRVEAKANIDKMVTHLFQVLHA